MASPILNMPPIGHKIAVRRYYAIYSKVPGNIISYRYLSNNDNHFELHAFDKCLTVQQQFCSKVKVFRLVSCSYRLSFNDEVCLHLDGERENQAYFQLLLSTKPKPI